MKSSFCASGGCIDVKMSNTIQDLVLITDTEDPLGVCCTPKANFAAFIKGVKAGEFDHFVEGAD